MNTPTSETTKKEEALKALEKRQKENAKKKKINNSDLPAGAPMYFYCTSCGAESDRLPENFVSTPKRTCGECQELKDKGWLK